MTPAELEAAALARRTLLCVGLDPDRAALSNQHAHQSLDWIAGFLKEVIQAALPYALAYKLNSAFYERWGSQGWNILKKLRALIPASHLTIWDAKRGDIAHTCWAYAQAAFAELGFDAVTVHPYMGWPALAPFYEWPDKWVFVLLRTTEAPPWQDQVWPLIHRERPIGIPAHLGWVWGAHHERELIEFRQQDPHSWLLMPGLGAQQASLAPQAPVFPALLTLSRAILQDPTSIPQWAAHTAQFLPNPPPMASLPPSTAPHP